MWAPRLQGQVRLLRERLPVLDPLHRGTPGRVELAAAEEEAVVNARIAEAEAAIAKTRDAAMANVSTIASDTARAIVEKLTGKAATAAEADAAVKGAA